MTPPGTEPDEPLGPLRPLVRLPAWMPVDRLRASIERLRPLLERLRPHPRAGHAIRVIVVAVAVLAATATVVQHRSGGAGGVDGSDGSAFGVATPVGWGYQPPPAIPPCPTEANCLTTVAVTADMTTSVRSYFPAAKRGCSASAFDSVSGLVVLQQVCLTTGDDVVALLTEQRVDRGAVDVGPSALTSQHAANGETLLLRRRGAWAISVLFTPSSGHRVGADDLRSASGWTAATTPPP